MKQKEASLMLEDLSWSRTYLMGLSILAVVVYHAQRYLVFPEGMLGSLLFHGVNYGGVAAVDVFVLLSGFGLAGSLQKNGNVTSYLSRRMTRLLPAYYPFILFFLGIMAHRQPLGLQEILGNLTFLGFWFRWETQFNWYVQAVMAFYLLAPVMHWLLERWGNRALFFLILLTAGAQAAFFDTYQMVAISRLPVFLLGFCLGRLPGTVLKWNRRNGAGLLFCAAAALMILKGTESCRQWGNGLYWYPNFLLAPAACFLIARLRRYLWKCKLYSWLDQGICLCGVCSFEIYLIHDLWIEWAPPAIWGNGPWFLLMAACVVLGIAYHFLVDSAKKCMSRGS